MHRPKMKHFIIKTIYRVIIFYFVLCLRPDILTAYAPPILTTLFTCYMIIAGQIPQRPPENF